MRRRGRSEAPAAPARGPAADGAAAAPRGSATPPGADADGLRIAVRSPLPAFVLDVDLEVPAGGRVALLGPSGAGKSTLLRCVAGLRRPTHGSVTCGGRAWFDAADGTDVRPERRRCGVLFQSYALFDHLDARANVAFGATARGRAGRLREADAWLERLGLAGAARRRPAELSGGERQRVALARTLAARPAALLLDEPLAALDARTRASAARELAATLDELDVPVLLVTHDVGEAASLADAVVVLEDGAIVQRGPVASLAAAPATPFVAELGGAVLLHGTGTPVGGDLTRVALHAGGVVLAGGSVAGPAVVGLNPWDVVLERAGEDDRVPGSGAAPGRSSRNALTATVRSLAPARGRVRVGLEGPPPLVAEVTAQAADALGLAVDDRVRASWKATATRALAAGGGD